jgi:hypothetical protein
MYDVEQEMKRFWRERLPGIYREGLIATEEDLRVRLVSALLESGIEDAGYGVFCEPQWFYGGSKNRPDIVVLARERNEVVWVIELKHTAHAPGCDFAGDIGKMHELWSRRTTHTSLVLDTDDGRVWYTDRARHVRVTDNTRLCYAGISHPNCASGDEATVRAALPPGFECLWLRAVGGPHPKFDTKNLSGTRKTA